MTAISAQVSGRNGGGKGCQLRCLASLRIGALLASTALLPAAALAQIPVLSTGGSVAAGQAVIGTPSTGALQITQTSDRAIINWQSFSVGEGGRVDISQPGAGSALLNRVTGTATSTIAGQINANGGVYLVNPNGILITRTGSVSAAAFTASTIDIDDTAFMAGADPLITVGASSPHLGRASGGYAGLLDGRAQGLIVARLTAAVDGKAALDLDGDGFMQIALPGAGISVAGKISADTVVLRAGTARDAVRQTVNLTGVIEARGVEARGGTITLIGNAIALSGATLDASGAQGGGTVRIGGDYQGGGYLAHAATLAVDATTMIRADATAQGDGGTIVLWSDDATRFAGSISATGAAGGKGGNAEVSGKAWLDFTGTADLTGAAFGTLLLDPYNLTISSGANSSQTDFTATGNNSVINVATLTGALANANVLVSTGVGGTQAGDITVAAPIGWSSFSTLTLRAAHGIAVNAGIDITGGGKLVLTTNHGGTGGELIFGNGAAATFAAGKTGQSLTIDGAAYTLIRDIAGLATLDKANGFYALAGNIVAPETTYTKNLISSFSGTFEGLGHTVSGLKLSTSGGATGLVGVLDATGTIRNLGVVGGVVSGSSYVGGLVGGSNGTILRSFSSATVTGNDYVGGLVGGTLQGQVRQSFATGSVTAHNGTAGGLVGFNTATISQSYATGRVSSLQGSGGGLVGRSTGAISASYATGDVFGSQSVGGFVGNLGNPGTLTQVYATGNVSGSANTGGLAGISDGVIVDAYATGSVRGNAGVGGLIGTLTGGGRVTGAYATGQVSGASGVGGFVGVNTNSATRIKNGFWDVLTSGTATGIGTNASAISATGLTTRQLQGLDPLAAGTPTLARTLGSSFKGAAGGLYPYLTAFFPGGVQAVSGIAFKPDGSILSSGASGGVSVAIDAGGTNLGRAATGANGYYYFAAPAGSAAAGSDLLASVPTNATTGATAGAAVIAATATPMTNVDVYGGVVARVTTAALSSQLPSLASVRAAAQFAASGDAAALTTIAAAGQTGFLSTASGFTVDQANGGGSLWLRTLPTVDLTVAAPIAVNGGNTVALIAGGALRINAPITVKGAGSVVLRSNNDMAFALGSSLTFANADGSTATAPVAGQALTIDNANYTLLYGLDGFAALDDVTGNFALARDIVAPTTAYLGNVALYLAGTLDGLGHIISGIKIDPTATKNPRFNTGFFAAIRSEAVLRNFGLVDATVSGGSRTGALAGYNDGTILQSYAAATVSGLDMIGGLVGFNSGLISNAHFTGSVLGVEDVGGLAGRNSLRGIDGGWVIASVTGTNRVGGIAGYNSTMVRNTFASGRIQAVTEGGGFIGQNSTNNNVTNNYWDVETSGRTNAFGSVSGNLTFPTVAGYTTRQLQGFDPISGTTYFSARSMGAGFAGGANGLYPYFTASYPTGAQAVSGTAYNADGTVAVGGRAGLYRDGELVGGTAAAIGANGYYYALAAPGSFASGTAMLGQTLTVAGTTALGGARFDDTLTLDARGNLTAPRLVAGEALFATALTRSSQLQARLASVFGASLATVQNVAVPTRITGLSIVDSGVAATGALIIENASTLTIAANGSVTSAASGDAIVLATPGGFINQAGSGAIATPNGRWLVASSGAAAEVRGGLNGTSYYGDAYNFATHAFASAPKAGNRFVYADQPTVTVTAINGSGIYTSEAQSVAYSVAGLLHGDTVAQALQGTAAGLTTNGEDVGSYVLTPSGLRSDANYLIDYKEGTYTITPATLTYVANTASRAYGDANQVFAGTLAGLVGDDTLDEVVVGTLAFTSTANGLSGIGQYGIGGSGLTSTNYVFSQAAGNATALTITPRAITIAANSQSRLYQDVNPTLDFAVGGAGLVNGDTLTGGLKTIATPASNVGAYAITLNTLKASENYAVTYQGANLIVTPRPITVTAQAKTRAYGAANPVLTYTVNKNLTAKTLGSGAALVGALDTRATTTSLAGTYAITRGTLTDLSNPNYRISFFGADLTITGRPVAVTADPYSRLYAFTPAGLVGKLLQPSPAAPQSPVVVVSAK